jgi:hypothetical protein
MSITEFLSRNRFELIFTSADQRLAKGFNCGRHFNLILGLSKNREAEKGEKQ